MLIPNDNGVILVPVEEQTGQLGPYQGVTPGTASDEREEGAEHEGGEGAGEHACGEDEADTEAAVHSLLEEAHHKLHGEDTDQVQPGGVN